MDQRTRRLFVQTIETFFPRSLCGGMEGYPTFDKERGRQKIIGGQHRLFEYGLTSDYVCGELRDAVESGERIIKCRRMPPLRFRIHCLGTTDWLYLGFWIMVSNSDRIIIYFPGRYYFYNEVSHKSRVWSLDSSRWEFYSLSTPMTEISHRLLDQLIDDYIHTYTTGSNVCAFPPPLPNPRVDVDRAWTINIDGKGTPGSAGGGASEIEALLNIMGYRAFLKTYTNLLETMHAIVPEQQRVARQRQRQQIVGQISGCVERSMANIRREIDRLETDMKTLKDSSNSFIKTSDSFL